MDARANPSPRKHRLRLWLILLIALAALFFLAAPAMGGRLLGDLWVTTMAAVMGLIGNLLGR